VVLADVSGKGVSAALLMAKLSGEVRFSLAIEKTPADAITRLGAGFEQKGWKDHFVTLVLTVLDPKKHEATIVNAGHMAPLLRTGGRKNGDGKVRAVGEEFVGYPLGVDSAMRYEQTSVPLDAGDVITLYTDGIHEAMNSAGACYGLRRLTAVAGKPMENVAQLGEHILADVHRFVGDRSQSDDTCLVCFGRDHA
jgi:serine phosphatase RsbU (regulator of sigma subunit)